MRWGGGESGSMGMGWDERGGRVGREGGRRVNC